MFTAGGRKQIVEMLDDLAACGWKSIDQLNLTCDLWCA